MKINKKSTLKELLLLTYRGLVILFGGVSISIILFTIKEECKHCFNEEGNPENIPKSLTKTLVIKCRPATCCLEVYTVLGKLGYKRNQTPGDNWDLWFTRESPFHIYQADLRQLKAHQKINHIPGNGYFTHKVELSTTALPYIPRSFKLPQQKEELLEYSKTHSNTTFVQKNNGHRDVKIVNVSNIDLDKGGTFVQEFMDKPFLVGGHKFDIGVYTIVTSIDPLRVYIYTGDAGLRFCRNEYYPFDPANVDKYVVGDHYLPVWQMPVLDYYYNQLGFGMKESLNAYLRSRAKDPNIIWTQIEDSIRIVLLAQEPIMAKLLKKYRYKHNFFELVRFDFIVDEDLRIYLLEANMSPTLYSPYFPPNKMLYQQVLYNVFGLVGIRDRLYKNTLDVRSIKEEEMIVSDKQLATYQEKCDSELCKHSCAPVDCQLCKFCLSPEKRRDLIAAFKEHLHRGECKRIFPPTESKEEALKPISGNFTEKNYLHYMWFKGKCLLDSSWC